MLDVQARGGFLFNPERGCCTSVQGCAWADSGETGVDDTARLEAALVRIARARRPAGGAAPAGIDNAALTARLDALIAELRGVLGRDSGD